MPVTYLWLLCAFPLTIQFHRYTYHKNLLSDSGFPDLLFSILIPFGIQVQWSVKLYKQL